MKKNALFKNLRLQTYLQVLNTLIPLVTTPYIARVLGPQGTGVFSFTTSNASYFTLFAMLGTISYGTRELANEKNEKRQTEKFMEIYALQVICVSIATIAYLIYYMIARENKLMVALQLITLCGYGFDVSWYYFGKENFSLTVKCSFIFRILGFISIFIFVKNPGDLWIYTVIMLSSVALNHIALWIHLQTKEKIKLSFVKWDRIKTHIWPNFLLFIPLIAVTINHSTDKTMLGMFSTYEQVGYYYNIEKIISVPLGILTGIGTVLLPRMTILFNSDREKGIRLFNNAINCQLMMGIAFSVGIMAVSKEFIPFFLGNGYEKCVHLVNCFAPVLIIKCLSQSVTSQFLVPNKMEKIYIRATIIGAGINIILNYFLIYRYGALGAEIATIVSESVAMSIKLYSVRKELIIRKLARDGIVYCAIAAAMYFTVRYASRINTSMAAQIAIEIVAGAGVFGLITLVYWKISKNSILQSLLRKNRD